MERSRLRDQRALRPGARRTLVALLDPRTGERILDLGGGDGAEEVLEFLHPMLRDHTGNWVGDYIRLCFHASKPA